MAASFRLAGFAYPPFVSFCAGDYPHGCDQLGLELDIQVAWLEQLLNVSKITIFDSTSYHDLAQAVYNGSYDMTALGMNNDQVLNAVERYPVLQPIWYEPTLSHLTLIVNKVILHEAAAANFILFSVCTWQVWIVVCLLTAGLRLAYHATKQIGSKVNSTHKLVTNFVCALSAIVLGLFLETCANFLSIVLAKPNVPPQLFASLEDLIPLLQTNTCHLAANRDIVANFDLAISGQNTPLWKAYKKALKMNPYQVLSDVDDSLTINAVANSTSMCLVGLVWTTSLFFSGHEVCSIQRIDDKQLPSQSYYYLMRRDHKMFRAVTMWFSKLTTSSMKEFVEGQYKTHVCNEEAAQSNLPQPITLDQLLGCFLILGICDALAAIILIIQRIRMRNIQEKVIRHDVTNFVCVEDEHLLLCLKQCSLDALKKFDGFDRMKRKRLLIALENW